MAKKITKSRGDALKKKTGAKRIYKVNVLERTVSILRAFEVTRPALTLSEICALTKLHPSTATRLLTTLQRHGFMSRDDDTNRYYLGYEILSLAEIVRSSSGLVSWALPTMRKLHDRFNETTFVTIRVGDYRVDLEQLVGLQEVRRVITLGVQKPLYIGAPGKIFLSAMSDDEVDQYIARTNLVSFGPSSITDPNQLRREVRAIRKNGYAMSVGEHSNTGGGAVSSLIIGRRGEVVGALTVTVPSIRLDDQLKRDISEAVLGGAREISAAIGGYPSRLAG